MKPTQKFIIYLVFALAVSTATCEQLENKNNHQDQETQASDGGYGLYGGLNNIYSGGIYGGYPGYYNRGYYGLLNGLGTSGLEYANLGYGGYGGLGYGGYGGYGYNGLGLSGIYPGNSFYGGTGNYYNPYGYYR